MAYALPDIAARNHKALAQRYRTARLGYSISGDPQSLSTPIAHAEGRYNASEETPKKINGNDQIQFMHCDNTGSFDNISYFNSSMKNSAGMCNERKNVLGMMPHPVRALDAFVGNTDGKPIFESILCLIHS